MKKESFIFRGEWKEALSGLPGAVRLEVYEAIIEYGTSGTLPTLKPMSMLAFNFMKTAIDRDKERYDEQTRKRSEAARTAAAARYAEDANASNRNERKQSQQTQAIAANATEDANASNSSYNDNDIVIDSDNDIVEEKVEKKKAASAAERAEAVVEAATKKLADEVATYDYPEEMKAAFVSYWTEPNASRTRVRYQMERTWDTKRRLATWASRDRSMPSKPSEIGRKDVSHDYDKPW